jgi:Skp family chaperone for outer membrane proteins
MRKISLKAGLSGLTALTLLAAPAAQAQTPPPAAATPTPAPPAPVAPPAAPAPAAASKGPLIAGVCLLSQEALIGRSKVGQAATARLHELTQQIQGNLSAEKARLEARAKALEAKRASLPPLQVEAQGQAINQRFQALQTEASERSQQMDATKTRAFDQVLQQAQPFIAEAYTAHGCGLLLARETVMTGNMGNDLTTEVVAALDAKATPIAINLEAPRPTK